MEKRVIVFDKDGTLLDFDALWVPVAAAATDGILCALGRSDIPAAELLLSIGVKDEICSVSGSLCYGTYALMARDMLAVLKRYGCAVDETALAALTREQYEKNLSAGAIVPSCDNLRQTLLTLKERGLTLILITLDTVSATSICLEKLGLKDLFDEVITDDGSFPVKPNPHCINSIMDRYSIVPKDVYVVGDTLTDVSFAEASGANFIGIAKNEENRNCLSRYAKTVISCISDLPASL